MTKAEGLNLLDYVEYVSKAKIEPMNVDQQETNKATHYHGEKSLEGASQRPPGKTWSSNSHLLWRTGLPRKIRKFSACYKKKKNAPLHDRIIMEDNSKLLVENRKCIL